MIADTHDWSVFMMHGFAGGIGWGFAWLFCWRMWIWGVGASCDFNKSVEASVDGE
jgi:hypothetical protein